MKSLSIKDLSIDAQKFLKMARYLPGFCNISDLGQYWETMSDTNVTPLVKKLLDSKMLREVDSKYIVDDWVKNVL